MRPNTLGIKSTRGAYLIILGTCELKGGLNRFHLLFALNQSMPEKLFTHIFKMEHKIECLKKNWFFFINC